MADIRISRTALTSRKDGYPYGADGRHRPAAQAQDCRWRGVAGQRRRAYVGWTGADWKDLGSCIRIADGEEVWFLAG
jgi:hypothetical protein